MSNIGGVIISNGAVQAIAQSADNIGGLFMYAPAAYSGLGYGEAIEVRSLADAEALGITAAYDTTNGTNNHRHVSEVFRLAPTSILWLGIYGEGTTASIAEALVGDAAKNFLINAGGVIKVLTVANCSDDVVATRFQSILNAVPSFKALRTWAEENFMPTTIILEGAGFNINKAGIDNLRNLTISAQLVKAEGVSIFIGVDGTYRDGLISDPLPAKAQFADIGTYLGATLRCKVSENPGELNEATRNLYQAKTAGVYWSQPSLAIDTAANVPTKAQMQSKAQELEDKGYCFVLTYSGLSGVYINNDHCVSQVLFDDDGKMNEFSISLSRTMDKAKRNLRAKLLPLVKSNVPVDTKTGKMPKAIITQLEDSADKVFEQMQRDGEISGGKTTIDPDSDLLTPPKTLSVSFALVPVGQIGEVVGTINLQKSL